MLLVEGSGISWLEVDVGLLRAWSRGGLPIARGVDHFAHAIEPVSGARARDGAAFQAPV